MFPLTVVTEPAVADPALERKEERRRRRLARTAKVNAAEDEENRFLLLKGRIAAARCEAYGYKSPPVLVLQLLAFRDVKSVLATDRPAIEKAFAWYSRAVEYALANRAIQYDIAEGFVKEESVRRDPPIRLRFEQASAFGGLGECLAATAGKSWGELVAVEPVGPNVDINPQHVGYLYHADSRYNFRFEQRKAMKRRLGKDSRILVKNALQSTQRAFLAKLTDGDLRAIGLAFKVDAVTFWRAAKGRHDLKIPKPSVQRGLFDGLEDEQ